MAKEIKLDELLGEGDPAEKIAALPFERALALLEELVSKVEGGALPLEVSILAYERGVVLTEHLRKKLSGAEEKLKILQKGSAT